MTGLSPEHRAELNGSRIASELIDGRGYRTMHTQDRDKLIEQGCPGWAVREDTAFPGLVIPMYRPRTGEYIGFQFKPAVPQVKTGSDKPVKYATPKGMGNRLDVHPACMDRVSDPAAPLWVTEGLKKGDALSSHGVAAVTLTGVWNWRNQQGALGDWEDVPLKGRTVVVCFDADAAQNPQVRNAMIRFVGWLRSRGAGTVHYLCVPDKVGETSVKGVDDYLAAGGTLQGLSAFASERAPQPLTSRDASFSDAFLTDTVCAEALDGSFLYTGGLGWMRYDGVKWSETNEAAIVEEIRVWAKSHWEEVVEEYKTDQSKLVSERMQEWKKVLASSRLKALASLARGPLLREAADFDAHQDLLNTPSGVVDLRTGELMDPDPQYLMTKVTGVPYVPGFRSGDFDQALCALPEDVRAWYRVRIGQAFTGHMPPDDVMLVQQGGGKNGKSTLAVPIKRAAGSYYVLVSDRVILGRLDQHPTELMELKGARYALMEETPEARQLNVQQLKRVVGTPDITARKIRQDSVTFAATHSLFVNTNFEPSVVETDHATWRRLALVRFPYTFCDHERDVKGPDDRLGDRALRERCMTQPEPAMAALSWAVQGAAEWYAANRVMPDQPDRVVDDTRAWKRKGDALMTWLEDTCVFGEDATATTDELFQSFGHWLTAHGHRPWTQRLFTDRLSAHEDVRGAGVQHVRRKVAGTVRRFWVGIRLETIGQNSADGVSISPFS